MALTLLLAGVGEVGSVDMASGRGEGVAYAVGERLGHPVPVGQHNAAAVDLQVDAVRVGTALE